MTYSIITFGCQMNISDSEKIKTMLNKHGLIEIKNEKESDVVIINTCSVKESAENRVFGCVENLYDLKKKNKNKKPFIIVTGCMPGRDQKNEIKKRFKNKIDLFIKINEIIELPKNIDEYFEGKFIDSLDDNKKIKFDPKNDTRNIDYLNVDSNNTSNFKAYIPIITGCNNFCSYCVVPFTRGREKSRDPKNIISEIKNLKEKGYKEITLLGQNVNSYSPENTSYISPDNPYKHKFAQLLWEINNTGIKRIYFTSSHPKDIDDEVIDALKLEHMGNYLHLAVQSGSNYMLKSMNRRYTKEDYLQKIEKIKKVKPNIAIGTDIIVGFPGETDQQFNETVELYKKADFDISYTSVYSDRTGTVSIKMDNKVKFNVKKERWNILHSLMEEIVLRKNQKYLNNVVSVLVEEYDNKKDYYIGHSSEQKIVKFKSEDKNLIGNIVEIKINRVEEWNLYGDMIKKA